MMISNNYNYFYNIMPDGTVKQINPFTGTEVWAVPGRGSKPILNEAAVGALPIDTSGKEDYCSFCETRYYETPPEKARLVRRDGKHDFLYRLPPDQYFNSAAAFRRTGNLFEIVTIDYWKKNYNYKLTRDCLEWRDAYTANPKGVEHLTAILRYKLKMGGKTDAEIRRKSEFEKLRMIDAFFGGCHELIIAQRHFPPGATHDNQILSSGMLSQDDHYHYFKFTIDAMRDMLRINRYIRYISVFQNWMRPAGASVDHLHKQLVGLDEWGNTLQQQIRMLRDDPNIFNEFGANLAAQYNLVFLENEHALAYIGIGHRFPTIEIFSKANACRPYEHSEEEIRGVSNLVHACHAAMGNQISCNEEWYYTPIDAVYKMPWHVLLKWRINVPAGFEGGTSIYINPITPMDLRDRLVPRLYELRDKGIIDSFRLAEECRIVPNPLKYYVR